MWTIDVWVPPKRDRATNAIIKPGYWMFRGSVDTDEEAEEALRVIARRNMIGRAKCDASDGGYTGMLASPKSFAKWTGSGGSF